MRKELLIAAVALTLACGHTAAQTLTPQQPVATSHKLNLTLEQRHVIKENVKDVKAEDMPAGFEPAPGDPVPANVQLQPIPLEIAQKVPQVKTHAFFVANGQVVIVDPKDRMVAEIIKLGAD